MQSERKITLSLIVLIISLMVMLLAVSLSLNLASSLWTGAVAAGSVVFVVLLGAVFLYWLVHQLEISEARLGAIVESAVDGIITTGEEGFIESVNTATLTMFGFRSGQLLGSRISVLFPSKYRDAEETASLDSFIRRNRMETLGRTYEVSGLRRDGSIFPMDFQVTEAFLGERKVFTVMLRDVTERHRAQEALRLAHAKLEERVAARTSELQRALTQLQEEVDQRTKTEAEREKLIDELQEAVTEIKMLSGMLPICSSCKNIRDDTGYWSQIEVYIGERSDAEFSHGLCPDCLESLYPEYRGEVGDTRND